MVRKEIWLKIVYLSRIKHAWRSWLIKSDQPLPIRWIGVVNHSQHKTITSGVILLIRSCDWLPMLGLKLICVNKRSPMTICRIFNVNIHVRACTYIWHDILMGMGRYNLHFDSLSTLCTTWYLFTFATSFRDSVYVLYQVRDACYLTLTSQQSLLFVRIYWIYFWGFNCWFHTI